MIGRCWFNTFTIGATTGADIVLDTITPDLDYGLLMVEYDATPPEPRIYRATIEGRDGTLDLSEWEGYKQVRYNDRTVTIKLRDINGQQEANSFIRRILGKRCYIHFDDDPDYYFRGRCEMAEAQTRQQVTDIDLSFTCYPFRYSVGLTRYSYSVPHGQFVNATISIADKNVIPTVEASGVESGLSANSTFNILRTVPEIYPITGNGIVPTPDAIFRAGNTNISIVNANVTAALNVTVSWRQEVI